MNMIRNGFMREGPVKLDAKGHKGRARGKKPWYRALKKAVKGFENRSWKREQL